MSRDVGTSELSLVLRNSLLTSLLRRPSLRRAASMLRFLVLLLACAALLAAGADVCYRGPDGRTPERRALDVGNVEAAAVMRAAVRAELESRQRSLIDEEEREAEATGAKAARSPAKPKQGGGRRR